MSKPPGKAAAGIFPAIFFRGGIAGKCGKFRAKYFLSAWLPAAASHVQNLFKRLVPNRFPPLQFNLERLCLQRFGETLAEIMGSRAHRQGVFCRVEMCG